MEPQLKEVMEMQTVISGFALAEGSVGPNPEQLEFADTVAERLASGEFHVKSEGNILCRCVDERLGGTSLAPCAAGGTETIYVADDLTDKEWTGRFGTTDEGYAAILETISSQHAPVGGHTDEHAQGDASGCGANDKLALIYDLIARRGDEIRAVAELLDLDVRDVTHDMIVSNAAKRTEFSKGAELLATLKGVAGEGAVEPLVGTHDGVVAVVNFRRDTTLDRKALLAAIPGAYAFNIDAWAFKDAAELIPSSEATVDEKVIAMTYYNLATGGVLFNKDMRIVVLK